jgi:tRNA pseudouridine55 synthase
LLLPLERGLEALPALSVTPDQAVLLEQGKRMTHSALGEQALCRAIDDKGRLVALVSIDITGEVRVRRGFNRSAGNPSSLQR